MIRLVDPWIEVDKDSQIIPSVAYNGDEPKIYQYMCIFFLYLPFLSHGPGRMISCD